MENVFCAKCHYYYKYMITGLSICEFPDNITTKHDWERKWKSYIQEPRKINKKNNCKWFKEE